MVKMIRELNKNNQEYKIITKTVGSPNALKVKVTIYKVDFLFFNTKVYERTINHEYFEVAEKQVVDAYFNIDKNVEQYYKDNKLCYK